MGPIQIKIFQELTREQLYSILKLRVDIFVVEQDCPYPELDNEDQKSVHFFYEEGEHVISYIRVIPTQAGNMRIGRVVTDKNFRGKALSSKLMEAAMAFIHENHEFKKIMLSAQEHLQAFYAKFGFTPVSKMYLEDGIPHVDMEFKQ